MSYYEEFKKSCVVCQLKKFTKEELSELFDELSQRDRGPRKLPYWLNNYLHEHYKNLEKNNKDE